jgi:dTMP kinase
MDIEVEKIRGRDLVRKGPFARLWWSQLISSLGDWVTLFATFSLATEISGDQLNSGIAILVPLTARFLPGLIIGVVGGVVADRFDRKRTMIVADFGRAVLVLVLVFVGNFRDLFLITFAIEVLSLIRQPAREAVVPLLIPREHLMAANGLNLLAGYGTAPVGSAIFAAIAQFGGSLAPWAANPGLSASFAFDAITFVLSGIIVLTISIPKLHISREREAESALDVRAPLRDMVDGFRFVLGFGAVRRMVVGMAVGLFGGGALFVLGQPFSVEVLQAGDSGYGIIVTALGVGVGIGMGAMTLWGRAVQRREPLFGFALLIVGMAIAFAAGTTTAAGAAAWVFLAGGGTGVAYVTGFTHLHAVVSDDLRGRTFAALFSFARAALLVSFALAGVGAAAMRGVFPGLFSNGVRAVMILSGATIFLTGIGSVWSVRQQLVGEPLTDHDYRVLRDASDAVTWVKGDRREKDR